MVLNSVVLGRGAGRRHWLPVVGGAVAPDAPMLGFYVVERFVLSTPERIIWQVAYFERDWQVLFDVFNSLPLIALGALVAWRRDSRAWLVFFASMALHCLTDLPFHRDDAHGHFFPFSDWRFASPISYWDPDHHGRLFGALEIAGVIAGSALLMRRGGRRRRSAWWWVGASTLAVYALYVAFAVAVWL